MVLLDVLIISIIQFGLVVYIINVFFKGALRTNKDKIQVIYYVGLVCLLDASLSYYQQVNQINPSLLEIISRSIFVILPLITVFLKGDVEKINHKGIEKNGQ